MAYEEAQQFLARVVPWPQQVDPPEFFVTVSAARSKGRSFTNLRAAIGYLQFIEEKRPADYYIVMSGQRMAQPAVNASTGKAIWKGARGRSNALWCKSFFVDVDVGKKDTYPDTITAVTEFGLWLEAIDLPMPTFIINSGSGGFHAHWVLDEPITVTVWQPIAEALVSAARAHNFKLDAKCSVNPAQLMRIPNTHNYKHTPPKEVELAYAGDLYPLERIERALLTYKSIAPARSKAPSAPPANTMPSLGNISKLAPMTELMPNRADSFPTLSQMEKCCPFIAAAHTSGGRDYRQPLWYETAKLAFKMKDGAAALHKMSNAHPNYTHQETQELYERIERERTPIDAWGWPHCDQLKAAEAAECFSCPWRLAGRVDASKTPFHFLGEDWQNPVTPLVQQPTPQVTSQVTPTFGFIPNGWHYDADGRIWRDESADADGEVIPEAMVFPYPARNFEVSNNEWGIQFQAVCDQQGWRNIRLVCTDWNDPRAINRQLGRQGLPLTGMQAKLMGELLPAFVQQLRDRKQQSVVSDRTGGWSYVDGKRAGFVYGPTRYNCVGDRPAYVTDAETLRIFSAVGSLEPWNECMDIIYIQNRPALEVIAASPFASPFMELTGENGLLVCARGETGSQKSFALRTGAAAYCHPKDGIGTVKDTYNSISEKLGSTPNLCTFWDEVQIQVKGNDLYQMMFVITEGRTKGRLNRASSPMPTKSWSKIFHVCANGSMRSLAAAKSKGIDSALYRVFEYAVEGRIEPGDPGYRLDAAILSKSLEQNYGNAFVPFAAWLGKVAADIQDDFDLFCAAIKADFGFKTSERFWMAYVCCILYGAQAANDLGITRFNIPAMYRFLKQAYMENRAYVEGADVSFSKVGGVRRVIEDFINDRRFFLLKTDTAPTGAGRPPALNSNLHLKPNTAEISGQHIETLSILRLSRKALREFCAMHEHSEEQLVEELVKSFGATRQKVKLGAGVPLLKRAQEAIIELDLTRPDLSTLL